MIITACVQRMASGNWGGDEFKKTQRLSLSTHENWCEHLSFARTSVLTQERGNRTGGISERCTAWYARSRRSLPNRPMPPAYMSSSADFGREKDSRCVTISRRFSVPADEWWGARPLAERGARCRGRARGGGQEHRPTDNNSLHHLLLSKDGDSRDASL